MYELKDSRGKVLFKSENYLDTMLMAQKKIETYVHDLFIYEDGECTERYEYLASVR